MLCSHECMLKSLCSTSRVPWIIISCRNLLTIPITVAAVNPNNDVSLEGWDDCGAFNNYTTAFYNTSEFAAKQKEAASFLNSLPPYLDGRNVSLSNMVGPHDASTCFDPLSWANSGTFSTT
jgi:hypothetical protein